MLMPGVLLGERYEIIEKIGAGGMSIVYKAKDNRLQRYVAIKELREEFARDEEFVAKFRKEALAAASLSHPNIVGIFDVGNDHDVHYIVMEYIEGKTLKELIAESGPFNSEKVLELGIQIVSALKHAHNKKIIHRDIKPQNILITTDHVLKVTDFGIAKAVDSSTIVATNNAIGSVHYFSPEQAKGKYVNETSDLYSCGIVLFELATNRLPFEADSHISIALKHINEEMPKPSLFNPNIFTGLEQIILKATDKRQGSRYQNADEMLADMNHVLRDPNYLIRQNDISAETILLSPAEMAFIRNSTKEEAPHATSASYKAPEPIREPMNDIEVSQTENIYAKDEMAKETLKEDDEEVSKLYKILVSVGGVLATLSVLVVIVLAITLWKPFGSKLVTVPNVKGRTVEIATRTLESLKLDIEVQEEVTDEAEPGIIFEQSPGENTQVKKKSVIIVKVAAEGSEEAEAESDKEAVEMVKVPNVQNISREEAEIALREVGLKVRFEEEDSESIAKGDVIRQEPSYGRRVEEGSTVVLTISSGESTKLVEVPDFVGKSLDAAQKTATRKGLSIIEAGSEYSEEVKEGHIISQNEVKGSKVEEGTTIEVVVSKGKEPEEEIKEETPTETPIETPTPPVEIGTPGNNAQEEIVQDVSKAYSINLPEWVTPKDSYRVIAKLTTEEGESSYVMDQNVAAQDFPLSVTLVGHGTGRLEVYIDDVSKATYAEDINFN